MTLRKGRKKIKSVMTLRRFIKYSRGEGEVRLSMTVYDEEEAGGGSSDECDVM